MATRGISVQSVDLERDAWWQHLVERGIVDTPALERAQALAAETNDRVEWVLVHLGLVTERALAQAYCDYLEIEQIDAEQMPSEALFADSLNARFLRHAKVVPLSEDEGVVHIAMADPLDAYAVRAMVFATGADIACNVATRSDIEAVLARLFPLPLATSEEDADDLDIFGDDVSRLRDLASEAPVIRFVNSLIEQAHEQRASDIHIEPTENRLRVRYRVDGVLRDIEPPPRNFSAAVISRIKIMAGMDIAERRIPQDGRIRSVIKGRAIDIRVSTSPTAYGESLVLRLLDRQALNLDLASLGIAGAPLERLENMLKLPHGIVLVTGPTGSGKTTTLYAALQKLNTPDRKILTIEDPIEYVLEGINQAQVKPEIGYTFAAALRTFLRQDPDVMMVGEIRDLETAEVSTQAALTGHIILSTLHTNDAPSAITRLVDMGVEEFLLSATLVGVLGQRLVRVLCPACKQSYLPGRDVLDRYGLKALSNGSLTLWREQGCPACDQTGFKGRTAIVEVLTMTEKLARDVTARKPLDALRAQAIADGMEPMLKQGLRKALTGVTTLEEVLRVTRDT